MHASLLSYRTYSLISHSQIFTDDFFPGDGNERAQGYVNVRLLAREERSQHQIGQDINLDCSVHGTVARPYEFVFTKDGQPLPNSKFKLIYI